MTTRQTRCIELELLFFTEELLRSIKQPNITAVLSATTSTTPSRTLPTLSNTYARLTRVYQKPQQQQQQHRRRRHVRRRHHHVSPGEEDRLRADTRPSLSSSLASISANPPLSAANGGRTIRLVDWGEDVADGHRRRADWPCRHSFLKSNFIVESNGSLLAVSLFHIPGDLYIPEHGLRAVPKGEIGGDVNSHIPWHSEMSVYYTGRLSVQLSYHKVHS
ncbi:hypothetical protein TI39_contig4224g00005 [Zymoseptoria brevis]|uniref:Uncharacterized protein n=1 Tax=Zymoseptoria brevis TaxID=1047168 RepID=A0A0F4G9L9_9PEZI|nr:hypothetical protein TI39_contig4224g00005 [Zymoseptoria brevis]